MLWMHGQKNSKLKMRLVISTLILYIVTCALYVLPNSVHVIFMGLIMLFCCLDLSFTFFPFAVPICYLSVSWDVVISLLSRKKLFLFFGPITLWLPWFIDHKNILRSLTYKAVEFNNLNMMHMTNPKYTSWNVWTLSLLICCDHNWKTANDEAMVLDDLVTNRKPDLFWLLYF